MSEDQLLAAARAGQAEALGLLFQQYRPYLSGVAAQILRDKLPSDGSDVVQDGFVTALKNIATFRGQCRPELLAWLTGIVRHLAIDRLRQPGRAHPLPDASPMAPGSSPGHQLLRREQAARVRAAVERLPEPYRQVIVLRTFEKLSFEEIAQRLNRKPATIRQQWTRGIKKLQECYGDET